MDFLKNLFKDDETQIIGLCGFKKEEKLEQYVPKFNPQKPLYSVNYENNFFLL